MYIRLKVDGITHEFMNLVIQRHRDEQQTGRGMWRLKEGKRGKMLENESPYIYNARTDYRSLGYLKIESKLKEIIIRHYASGRRERLDNGKIRVMLEGMLLLSEYGRYLRREYGGQLRKLEMEVRGGGA